VSLPVAPSYRMVELDLCNGLRGPFIMCGMRDGVSDGVSYWARWERR